MMECIRDPALSSLDLPIGDGDRRAQPGDSADRRRGSNRVGKSVPRRNLGSEIQSCGYGFSCSVSIAIVIGGPASAALVRLGADQLSPLCLHQLLRYWPSALVRPKSVSTLHRGLDQ